MELAGWRVAIVVGVVSVCGADLAWAQLGALVSPGRLSRPHAELEGVGNCLQCHAAGRQVATDKCLACHPPIADRIARRRGIHRDAGSGCVRCHVEHAGVDAELRPFDVQRFDHGRDAAFTLDGLHAGVGCVGCHKTRSYLAVAPACSSCHADPHKPTLGDQCGRCHTTSVRFAAAAAQFDHSRTAYPLTGAHTAVACARCHADKAYKGVAFASCASCHADPHRPRFTAACASCHTTARWQTQKVDHSRTAFPLRGRHAAVACVKCHVKPALDVTPRSDSCAACHADPHRGVFRQDCAACHTDAGFRQGRFDHGTTGFPLVDRHAGLPCVACHKDDQPARRARTPLPADYRGLRTACDSCHFDVHKAELGPDCGACHSGRSFALAAYQHARPRPFFEGRHAPVSCSSCHGATLAPVRTSTPTAVLRVGFVTTSTECVSCHRDVHLGQVDQRCERCHAIDAPKFAVVGFVHDRARFVLTGRHTAPPCEGCHKVQTRSFPAGHGTARALTGLGTECVACHPDPHAGQLDRACQTCHSADSFALPQYTHRNLRALRAFFSGKHLTAACAACHARPPAAAAVYAITTSCVGCHSDVHRGALGPQCDRCHRP
jgi:hypothetical protein